MLHTEYNINFETTQTLITYLHHFDRFMLEPVDAGEFRRSEERALEPNSIRRFPHGVFELSLRDDGEGGAWPDWVNDLVDDGSLIEIFKFSKFMTGMAWLYSDNLELKPAWLDMLSEHGLGGMYLRANLVVWKHT